MERLFSPCTRYRDILESQGRLEELRGPRESFQELGLDVSTEELFIPQRGFTYADLYAMLRNEDTIAWLTPHAAVARTSTTDWGQSCRFRFSADDKDIEALANSPEHLLEICDVVLRLLAASDVHSVHLDKCICYDVALLNAPTLAYLLEQCQSLKALTLVDLVLDEDHCNVLGGYSRPDLEIVMTGCEVTNAGTCTLAEVLGRNQGPTKLDFCYIDNSVLANGLRGNNRLKSFRPRIFSSLEVGKQELLAIASALRENKGLIKLDLSDGCFRENDETWDAICDPLEIHPTLEILNLRSIETDATMAPAVITSRIQALLDIVKMNMSIHKIHLCRRYREHELFRGSVIPYLETNRLRPRLLAIQKTRSIAFRARVLGRALLSTRSDANSFWMLLSGNAEVAFPSRSTTIAAMNLPTPAATAVTAAISATAAAPVVPTLTTTATGSLPTAAKPAATSTATPSIASASGALSPTIATTNGGQKRKARP
jgi:hypothetical protein